MLVNFPVNFPVNYDIITLSRSIRGAPKHKRVGARMKDKCRHNESELKYSEYEKVRVGDELFVQVYRNDICSNCGFCHCVAMYQIHTDLEFLLDMITGKGKS